MNKWVIGIFIVLVLIIGVYFITSNNSEIYNDTTELEEFNFNEVYSEDSDIPGTIDSETAENDSVELGSLVE